MTKKEVRDKFNWSKTYDVSVSMAIVQECKKGDMNEKFPIASIFDIPEKMQLRLLYLSSSLLAHLSSKTKLKA